MEAAASSVSMNSDQIETLMLCVWSLGYSDGRIDGMMEAYASVQEIIGAPAEATGEKNNGNKE